MSISVVHILYSGLGGHGSVFFSLTKADEQKEATNYAVFCGVENVNPDYIELCNRYGVAYSAILKKPGADFSPYFRIYSVLRKVRPEVIVLHGPAFIFPAWLYRKTHGNVKIIVRETQAHHLKTKRDWQWLKWAVKLADKLIFLTTESLTGVIQKFPKLPVQQKAVIIPNGIDTDLYSPHKEPVHREVLVLGMQSRLQKIKDHPTLFKSFKAIQEKYKEQKIRLRIAGDGVTRAGLENLAQELGITKDIEFCGMLSETDLVPFMKNLDIYVHATYGETLSNSIMQAMSCGLPIVASDVWGVNNMLSEKSTALLVPVEDVQAMTAAISLLIENDKLRVELGKNAREVALERYSNRRLFKQYMDVYENS